MNIPQMRGMGLISTPTFDVLLNGERPKSLSELIRHQQIKKEAEEAANRISQSILEKMKRTNKASF
ncbi:TPA: hypothetical protein ACJKZR_001375 [Acinetobacter baumannii]|uniref:hypothetical protein n=1 Tax=Acinetobacter baumannii TaxID=470 RepID=UPI001CA6D6E9|nr:hypothetical protein [Acinetobacter baumannii]EKV7758770.1 hypothetical protein [Acinetobacter baumannii]EKW8719730.1 hypothetical protein [Acinetobacter baumannii]ELB7302472.1 hypothetical protein [Acinetobacter baumannii]ELH1395564.1 hypothetical protein [Acinetobacter baumannii]ELH1446922.1 hypothetical protein [Acinetobacter baumannii]